MERNSKIKHAGGEAVVRHHDQFESQIPQDQAIGLFSLRGLKVIPATQT